MRDRRNGESASIDLHCAADTTAPTEMLKIPRNAGTIPRVAISEMRVGHFWRQTGFVLDGSLIASHETAG